MENAQLRDAEDENDALCASSEVKPKSSYELVAMLSAAQFFADQGDYLMCRDEQDAQTLLVEVRSALRAEGSNEKLLYERFAAGIGRLVLANFTATLNELHGKDLL